MDLNHPIVVVAILGIVVVIIDKIFFFARSVSKNKNGQHSMEKFGEVLEKININLTLLNERIDQHNELETNTAEHVREIRAVILRKGKA